MSAKLRLDIEIEPNPATLGRAASARVVLTNTSAAPVVVNRRMAIGQATDNAREIYIEMFTADGEPVSFKPLFYDRDLAGKDDFAELAPGKSAESTFDFLRWHALDGPGTFDVVAVYRGVEAFVQHPDDAYTGEVRSKPLRLVVRGPEK